jgi:outer membrane protein OmpA-like peptidoglycan-associated protein
MLAANAGGRMSKWLSLTVAGGVIALLPACASRGVSRTRAVEINSRVNNVTETVELTQDRTRQNEGTAVKVTQKATAAEGSARQAEVTATAAEAAARTAATKAGDAGARSDALAIAARRTIYTVVLSDTEGRFKFGTTEVPDDVRLKIDALVTQLKLEPGGAYLEIEGHTDSVGATGVNERIGLERAEAVKRYIFEQHQVPLHKMSVVSYGKSRPVASNTTSGGRAQNRRIVIRVLV